MPTIRELPAVDAAADTTTAYTLPYFIERFEGVLHDRDDEDRLAIHLTAGEAVTLTLAGDERTNLLAGAGGDDTLYGNAGNDTLVGGPGDDILFGGAGADNFVFAAGHGADAVPDFGRGDRIDLSGFDGLDSFEGLALAQDGPHAVIDLGEYGGGTLTLQYLDAGGLAGEDFIFAA